MPRIQDRTATGRSAGRAMALGEVDGSSALLAARSELISARRKSGGRLGGRPQVVGHLGPVSRVVGEVVGQHDSGATATLHRDGQVA